MEINLSKKQKNDTILSQLKLKKKQKQNFGDKSKEPDTEVHVDGYC